METLNLYKNNIMENRYLQLYCLLPFISAPNAYYDMPHERKSNSEKIREDALKISRKIREQETIPVIAKKKKKKMSAKIVYMKDYYTYNGKKYNYRNVEGRKVLQSHK